MPRAIPTEHSRLVRALLADREGAARRALATLIGSLKGVTLVGEVATREHLADAVRRLTPDVVVIDDRLLLTGEHPLVGVGPLRATVRLIVVGVDDDPAFAARAHSLGAHAWVAKDRADEDLPRLLETVMTRLLIAYDASESSRASIAAAAALFRRRGGRGDRSRPTAETLEAAAMARIALPTPSSGKASNACAPRRIDSPARLPRKVPPTLLALPS